MLFRRIVESIVREAPEAGRSTGRPLHSSKEGNEVGLVMGQYRKSGRRNLEKA